MSMRALWRITGVMVIALMLAGTMGCGHWHWRHHDNEIEYEENGGPPGLKNHPHGGPPGQMKKNGNNGTSVNIDL